MTADDEDLVSQLSENEKTVLQSIARTKKLRPLGAFSERELTKKHQVRDLNVRIILQDLQRRGIIQQVSPGKRLWKVVRPEIEHACEVERLTKQLGFSVVRR